ncbi:MAG: response regulator transcription factor [Lachnospiraceae bacterium]|nr:response regulator transcription factor [Lachnospiraceae bacterium]MDY5647917.1 response regulator transcription factor [Lachnospiraceae bacterium]
MKKVILTVDDEEHILELIGYNLEINGYDVLKADSGEAALKLLQSEHVDLVLLDRMLPGIDGIEVLKEIRTDKNLKNLPVILLTAKTEEFDKVVGLEIGADDYIGKPFGIHELIARIKAVLRRAGEGEEEEEAQEEILELDNLVINYTTRVVTMDGREVELSLKEFELLYLLAGNRNRVFSRDTLLEKIWGYDYMGETRTIDVHIRNLRKKIERDPDNPEHIKTVRGIGYKFV